MVGGLLVLFALVMFDALNLPGLGINVNRKRPTDTLGILFFGMTSGLIVGPCTAPVLGSLLAIVATKQNILLGAALLFVFSYGVGFSLILIGTFSGLLSRLPKSGPWLLRVKQLSGLVLLFFGIYFLYQAYKLF